MLNFLRFHRLPALLSGSLLLFAGGILANVGNYAFNLTMGRLLPAAQYGDMIVLFSLGTILAVPTVGIINIVTRDVARLQAAGQQSAIAGLVSGGTRKFLAAGLLLMVLFLAVTPLIVTVFHLSPLPTVLYAATLALTFLVALNQGTVQGLERFRALSAFLSLQIALKLVLGIGLVVAGYGLVGAIGGVVLAQGLFFLAMTVFLTRRLAPAPSAARIWKIRTKENQAVILGVLLFYIFLNLDLLFAKHFFDPDTAGAFAVLTTLGRIILFATGSVAVALLPMASRLDVTPQRSARLLGMALALVYVPGFLVAYGYALFPSFVVDLLFPGYESIKSNLGLYGGLSALFGLLNLLVYYFIAVSDYRFIYVLGGSLVLSAGLMAAYHQSFFELITAAVAGCSVAVLGCLALLAAWRRPPEAAAA